MQKVQKWDYGNPQKEWSYDEIVFHHMSDFSGGVNFSWAPRSCNWVNQYFSNLSDGKNDLGVLIENMDHRPCQDFSKSKSPGEKLGSLYFQLEPLLQLVVLK